MGGWETKGREGCVCGEYCVDEGKRDKKGEVKLMGSRLVIFQGCKALRKCFLFNGWYQER
jgi:hypothetical protein